MVGLTVVLAVAFFAAFPAPAQMVPDAPALSPSSQALFEAVRTNDLDALRQAINAGADLTARDEWGSTAADLAVDKGYFAIVQYLLSLGAIAKPAGHVPPAPPAATTATAEPSAGPWQPRRKPGRDSAVAQQPPAAPEPSPAAGLDGAPDQAAAAPVVKTAIEAARARILTDRKQDRERSRVRREKAIEAARARARERAAQVVATARRRTEAVGRPPTPPDEGGAATPSPAPIPAPGEQRGEGAGEPEPAEPSPPAEVETAEIPAEPAAALDPRFAPAPEPAAPEPTAPETAAPEPAAPDSQSQARDQDPPNPTQRFLRRLGQFFLPGYRATVRQEPQPPAEAPLTPTQDKTRQTKEAAAVTKRQTLRIGEDDPRLNISARLAAERRAVSGQETEEVADGPAPLEQTSPAGRFAQRTGGKLAEPGDGAAKPPAAEEVDLFADAAGGNGGGKATEEKAVAQRQQSKDSLVNRIADLFRNPPPAVPPAPAPVAGQDKGQPADGGAMAPEALDQQEALNQPAAAGQPDATPPGDTPDGLPTDIFATQEPEGDGTPGREGEPAITDEPAPGPMAPPVQTARAAAAAPPPETAPETTPETVEEWDVRVTEPREQSNALPPVPREIKGEGRKITDAAFTLGQSVRLGKTLPEAPIALDLGGSCIEKRDGLVVFCVEGVDWPSDIEAFFKVNTVMYQGTKSIVRYDKGSATRIHALFPSEGFERVVDYYLRQFGPPTTSLQRSIAPLAAPRQANPMVMWQSVDPKTNLISTLEIRKFDDSRGGFPDIKRGAVMLYNARSAPIFPQLSALDLMFLRR